MLDRWCSLQQDPGFCATQIAAIQAHIADKIALKAAIDAL